MIPRFRLLALLGAAPAVLAAQQPAPLTYEQAMHEARTRAPLLAAAAGRRQLIEGRARADAALPNPTYEFRRENLGVPLAKDEFSQVTVPVDLSGRRVMLLAAVGAGGERARADSASFARAVLFDAARAWWRASVATGAFAVASEHRRALHDIADWDARRAAEGAIAEAAAMRTRLEADRARLAEASARGELARARTDLARLLGMVAESLPPVAEPPLVLTHESVTPDSAAALAMALRPELALARAAAREAQWRARAERQGVLGDVAVTAGTKVTGGFASRLVGVQVPMPVFSWNGGNRERAAGERAIANAELRDTELRIAGEARAAARTLALQHAASDTALPGMAQRARDVALAADASYREGAASIVELLDARRTAMESLLAALRGAADLALARLELARATGAPLPDLR
jgi:cobalt-zinc-cadmium efflux system outer membrane protein